MEGITTAAEREHVEERTAQSPKAPLVIPSRAYGTTGPTARLGPMAIKRREPGPQDVQIEILYCGICHSDLHAARNEWAGTMYPSWPATRL